MIQTVKTEAPPNRFAPYPTSVKLGYQDANEPTRSSNGFLHLNNSKMLLQTMQPDVVAKHLRLDGARGSTDDLRRSQQGSRLSAKSKPSEPMEEQVLASGPKQSSFNDYSATEPVTYRTEKRVFQTKKASFVGAPLASKSPAVKQPSSTTNSFGATTPNFSFMRGQASLGVVQC